jgi:hypothetical protein
MQELQSSTGIGIDALPASIRQSNILTETHLAQLGSIEEIPLIDPAFEDLHLRYIVQYFAVNPDELEKELHTYAAILLNQRNNGAAWQVLLYIP